jgi:hypothetical protein
MRFLLHHAKARLDPRSRYPWARSVISAFFPYTAPPPPLLDWRQQLRGRIAAYALGRDYHAEMSERLGRWAGAIMELSPGVRAAGFVDTAAVFEHEWAARAGVGTAYLVTPPEPPEVFALTTDHQAAHWNNNLILFAPISLLLILTPSTVRKRRFAKHVRVTSLIVLSLTAISILLNFVPGLYQANWDLIALSLPIDLSFAAALWVSPQRRTSI